MRFIKKKVHTITSESNASTPKLTPLGHGSSSPDQAPVYIKSSPLKMMNLKSIKEIKEREKKCRKIISFRKKEKTKLPASDIDFQLRIGDVDLVKELCEELYRDKKIGRTGNYRYFK